MIVYVEWQDACGKSGWMRPEDHAPPVHIKSIGYVMTETKEYLCLSPGVDEANNHFMGFITIPKGWIKKRKTIKA